MMFEIGRLCMKIAGRDAGEKCVIVDKGDENYVLIDGGTRRRKCNIKHLEPLEEVIKIKKGASHEEVVGEFKKLKLEVRETKPKEKKERPKKRKKVRKEEEKKEEKKEIKKEKKKEELEERVEKTEGEKKVKEGEKIEKKEGK